MLNYERARNRNVGRTVEYRLCLQYWKQRMFNRQRPLVTFSEVAFSIQDIFYFSASVVRQIKSLYNNRMLFFVHSIFLWCPIDISKKNHVCTYFFIFFLLSERILRECKDFHIFRSHLSKYQLCGLLWPILFKESSESSSLLGFWVPWIRTAHTSSMQ